MRLPLLVGGLAGASLDGELNRTRDDQPLGFQGKGDNVVEGFDDSSIASGTGVPRQPEPQGLLWRFAHSLDRTALRDALGAQLVDLCVHLGGGCSELGDREGERRPDACSSILDS